MKRVYLLVFLGLVLVVLVFLRIYRYDTLEKTAGMHRYVDNWTKYEWVKVTTSSGTDRYPQKYYNTGKPTADMLNDTIAELGEMRRIESVFAAVWYVLMIGTAGLFIYVLMTKTIQQME